MDTRYDVYANGVLDNGTHDNRNNRSYAGLVAGLAHARTQAQAREGVRFVVMRSDSDQRGPAVEVGRYCRVGKKLTAWVR